MLGARGDKRRRVATYVLAGTGVLVAAALLVHFAHTLFGFGSPEHDFLIEEWVYDFVTATAAVLTLACAVLRKEGRLAWVLLGLGLAFWAAADLYWTLVLGKLDELPFPSGADALYLVGYVFVLAGVGALVRQRVRRMSAIVWTDVAIAALCVGAIGTAVLMEFVVQNTSGTGLEVAVALAYPLLDLVTLAVAAAALALTGWRPGRALGLVALGIVCAGIGDAVYTQQELNGSYDPTTWNNSLWPLSTVLIAGAALLPQPRRITQSLPEGWGAFASPTIFALSILALLMLDSQSSSSPVVAVLTIATLVAVVIRLAITFGENRRLLDQLQHDPLTSLANRSKLFVDLRRILDAEQPEPHLLAVLDLDGFKTYNDAFGHPAGDSLLIRLGTQLAAAMRGRGLAYRLGGDEFAVIARGDDDTAIATITEAAAVLCEQGEGFEIGSSVGYVRIPAEADRPMNAIQIADQRMYGEKDSHRPSPGVEVQAVLVGLLQQRAPELGAHGQSVANLAMTTAEGMGVVGSELTAIGRAAELHDVGKMAIPDAILQKPGPLDEQEWEFMRQHTVFGERILSAADSLAPLGAVVRSSHERWDGDGYPDGLAGDAIPLAARIIFACDAFDAMTSARPYAPTRTESEAIEELRDGAGSQFDPAVVEALTRSLPARSPKGPVGVSL